MFAGYFRAAAARRRGDRARRARRQGGRTREDPLGRAEAAARPRRRARRRSRARLPRRADDRLRPVCAAHGVGPRPLAALARQDDPADDALPRRGAAARRPRRGDPRGRADPHRHAARADRRPPPRSRSATGEGGARSSCHRRADPGARRADGPGARRGRELEALEVRRATLEDVYLDLVDEEPESDEALLRTELRSASSSSSGATGRRRSSSSSSRRCCSCSSARSTTGTSTACRRSTASSSGSSATAARTPRFAGLAIQLVIRRESGILKRLRATPLPPPTYIAALLASTLVVFVLQTLADCRARRALYDADGPEIWLARRGAAARRRRVRGARHRPRVADPLGGGLVGGGQPRSCCRWRSSRARSGRRSGTRLPPGGRGRSAAHVPDRSGRGRLPPRRAAVDDLGPLRCGRVGRGRASSSPARRFGWEPRER